MKKQLLLISVLSITALSGLVSCGSKDSVKAEDILKTYLLEQDNSSVEEDFKVLGALKSGKKSYPLTWTTSDSALTVSDTVDKTGYYTVAVTLPEDKEVEVDLTCTLKISKNNVATKTFKVSVYPIDVYSFIDGFVLDIAGTTVYSDFVLPTETTYKEKSASINWKVGSKDESGLITISDGKTAVVTQSSVVTKVPLTATFTYKDTTASKDFYVNVYTETSDYEKLMYWYNHTGITQTLSGYVVALGTYTESYGEANLFVLDDSLQGGFYVYGAYFDQETYNNLQLGTHITVTGATNTSFKGLLETNYGGTAKVDDKTPINVNDYIHAMDNDLIANVHSLYYRTSTLVTLSGWKVKEIKTSTLDTSKSTNSLLILEKDGVTTAVVYSKNIKDTPLDATCDAAKGVMNTIGTLNVGDYVDISGVLSYYNTSNEAFDQKSYQVMVNAADSIKKVSAPTTTVVSNGVDVGKAYTEVTGILPTGTVGGTEKVEYTLPAKSNNVDVTYEIAHPTSTKSAEIKDGKLIVTPGKAETVSLNVTFQKGDYKTVERFEFISDSTYVKPTEPEKTLYELDGLSLVTTPVAGQAYKFAVEQTKLSNPSMLYITGEMSGYYGATVSDKTKAVDVYVETSGDGYHLYTTKDSSKVYIDGVVSGSHYNYVYVNESAVTADSPLNITWMWDSENNTFKGEITEGVTVYIGAKGTYQIFQLFASDYLSENIVAHLFKAAE